MDVANPNSDTVTSPCVSVCQVDGEDMCVGCGRMISEIVEWTRVSEARRGEIVALAAERLALRAAKYPV